MPITNHSLSYLVSNPQSDNLVVDQGLEKLLVYFRGLLLDLVTVEHARFILERSTGSTKLN